MEGYNIRLLEKKDCKKAAKLRLIAQKQGFLPAMGLRFQIEILKGVCESKWGFGIVCIAKDDEILGMLYATTKLSSFYKSILFSRGPMLVLWGILRILQKPKLFYGVLQYLVYPRKSLFKEIEAEWLTLVVDTSHRNQGIAKALTLSLIEEYRKCGVNKFKSTVPHGNIVSCSLHDRLGFKFIGTFFLCGELINIYEYEL
jgi:ribosomal protein S18 acetylase RimI-like enzyme